MSEIIDEHEWVKSMTREYTELLKEKYGDGNFTFVLITLKYEDNGIISGYTSGYSSETFRRGANSCKDLLARIFALEKVMRCITGGVATLRLQEIQEGGEHED